MWSNWCWWWGQGSLKCVVSVGVPVEEMVNRFDAAIKAEAFFRSSYRDECVFGIHFVHAIIITFCYIVFDMAFYCFIGDHLPNNLYTSSVLSFRSSFAWIRWARSSLWCCTLPPTICENAFCNHLNAVRRPSDAHSHRTFWFHLGPATFVRLKDDYARIAFCENYAMAKVAYAIPSHCNQISSHLPYMLRIGVGLHRRTETHSFHPSSLYSRISHRIHNSQSSFHFFFFLCAPSL